MPDGFLWTQVSNRSRDRIMTPNNYLKDNLIGFSVLLFIVDGSSRFEWFLECMLQAGKKLTGTPCINKSLLCLCAK